MIERDGRIVAFANVLAGSHHDELSVDLMRYHRDAPRSVMEAWEPHYLACQGAVRLPRLMRDVSALVAGATGRSCERELVRTIGGDCPQ